MHRTFAPAPWRRRGSALALFLALVGAAPGSSWAQEAIQTGDAPGVEQPEDAPELPGPEVEAPAAGGEGAGGDEDASQPEDTSEDPGPAPGAPPTTQVPTAVQLMARRDAQRLPFAIDACRNTEELAGLLSFLTSLAPAEVPTFLSPMGRAERKLRGLALRARQEGDFATFDKARSDLEALRQVRTRAQQARAEADQKLASAQRNSRYGMQDAGLARARQAHQDSIRVDFHSVVLRAALAVRAFESRRGLRDTPIEEIEAEQARLNEKAQAFQDSMSARASARDAAETAEAAAARAAAEKAAAEKAAAEAAAAERAAAEEAKAEEAAERAKEDEAPKSRRLALLARFAKEKEALNELSRLQALADAQKKADAPPPPEAPAPDAPEAPAPEAPAPEAPVEAPAPQAPEPSPSRWGGGASGSSGLESFGFTISNE